MEHWECPACHALTTEDKAICWNCHLPRLGDPAKAAAAAESTGHIIPRSPTVRNNTSKYPALETVSTLLRATAVAVLILCLVGAAFLVAQLGGVEDTVSGIALAVLGLLQWLFLRAAAESLIVLIDIERNTRAAAEAVQGIARNEPIEP